MYYTDCVRIPLFATLRHLQHEIDNLKAEVVVLRQTQDQCHPTEAPPTDVGKNKDGRPYVECACTELLRSAWNVFANEESRTKAPSFSPVICRTSFF